jgi:transcriptional regulator with XRE-family HTH domain
MEMPTKASNRILAENVRRQRLALGWTQSQLAERLQVSQPRIAEIERAKGNVSMDTLDDLADCLEVAPATLLIPVEIGELVPA